LIFLVEGSFFISKKHQTVFHVKATTPILLVKIIYGYEIMQCISQILSLKN
jgi:hypothetical protein